MLTIECVQGDIIQMAKDHEIDVVVHGCNCFHIMGGGIAKQINDYTQGKALEADKKTPHGDINKLGTYSMVEWKGIKFYNLYSQHIPAHGYNYLEVCVHWKSVRDGLIAIVNDQCRSGIKPTTIAIPYIGCGLANGKEEDLKKVLNFLEQFFKPLSTCNDKILVVEYKKD